MMGWEWIGKQRPNGMIEYTTTPTWFAINVESARKHHELKRLLKQVNAWFEPPLHDEITKEATQRNMQKDGWHQCTLKEFKALKGTADAISLITNKTITYLH